jgi:hypothetical protein
MTVDQKRRILWVATSALPPMNNYDVKMEGQAGVMGFDLESGKVAHKDFAPADSGKHSFGDVALDGNGNVYVTDSASPAIYRVKVGTSKLEKVFEGDPFVSMQGLTFGSDDRTLYVADYSIGLVALDLKAKQARLLNVPDNVTLLGTDGLYWHEGRLIAIQNGINPHRVARVSLDKSGGAVTGVEVLESRSPLFDEPTLGVVARAKFWFVANSQWGLYGEDGKLKEGAELKDPVILELSLK